MNDEFKTLRKFDAGKGREGFFYSLPALEEQGIGQISRLPASIRIVLESVLRNCDGQKVRRKDVEALANWNAKSPANEEIPFIVARIVLQDFTGVPLMVDLAAMRSAVKRLGHDPKIIEPLVPVDLVGRSLGAGGFLWFRASTGTESGHGIQAQPGALSVLKWGQQAFKAFQLIPPGIGIVHQVNLEYLAKAFFPLNSHNSTLNFSSPASSGPIHTTMINGLASLAGSVGGIEARACSASRFTFHAGSGRRAHMQANCVKVSPRRISFCTLQIAARCKSGRQICRFYGEAPLRCPFLIARPLKHVAEARSATMDIFRSIKSPS
jgi:aconitate hydratase